jgi:hypothetical protein
MALPLADELGLSRNCAEAAWQVNCLGMGQQAQSLHDDNDDDDD